MTPAPAVSEIDTVCAPLTDTEVSRLVRKTSRTLRAEEVELLGHVQWPMAHYRSTATSQGRRTWSMAVHGAVDLVSSRIGLVPGQLAVTTASLDTSDTIAPPRVGRAVAERLWYEYFRDKVYRRQRPWRPPALAVGRVELVHVPHALASCGSTLYLVDPMNQHAEELSNFPWVERHVQASGIA